jgi:PDZ domain-containing secreted protein
MHENIVHFWQSLATVSLGIIVTLISFWVGLGRKIVSREEIEQMLETKSPYLQDKQFIMERLSSNKETQAAFANALQRNSDVMNDLKIQLATLGKTLEALEDKIERGGNR